MSVIHVEPIRKVRAHLADVVDLAADRPTIITRRGRQVAAIVPIELLRHYEQLEEQELNRVIDERLARSGPEVPLEVVIEETIARDE